jgi:hypothetical protein
MRFTRRSVISVAPPLGVAIAMIVLGVPFFIFSAVFVGLCLLSFGLILKVRDPRLLLLLALLMVLAIGFGALQVLVYAHLPFWALLLVLLGIIGLEVRQARRRRNA